MTSGNSPDNSDFEIFENKRKKNLEYTRKYRNEKKQLYKEFSTSKTADPLLNHSIITEPCESSNIPRDIFDGAHIKLPEIFPNETRIHSGKLF